VVSPSAAPLLSNPVLSPSPDNDEPNPFDDEPEPSASSQRRFLHDQADSGDYDGAQDNAFADVGDDASQQRFAAPDEEFAAEQGREDEINLV
jgi:hypothetical protein